MAEKQLRPVRATRKKVSYSENQLQSKSHSQPQSQPQSQLESQSKKEQTTITSDSESSSDGSGSWEESVSKTPEVLLEEDGIKGADVYQFKKMKRTGQMAQLAKLNATPVSTKRQAKPPTTSSQRVTRRSRLRRSIPDSDSDSDFSKDSSSDEESDSDDGNNVHSTKNNSSATPGGGGTRRGGRGGKTPVVSAVKMGPTTRRRARAELDLPIMAEEYFSSHAGASLTSDHTLAQLAIPQMDQGQVTTALENNPNSHFQEIDSLYQEYQSLFNQWMFQLSNGFNLMLYGLGSKRCLLDQFRAEMLSNYSHVIINGFFPSLTVKSILNSITEDVLENDPGFRSLAEQLDFIKDKVEESEEPLFLIVHNIDGPMLRGHKAQSVLSSLSQIRLVSVIATIDHINAPLIWDQSKSTSFYWLWYDVTTFEPYTEETSYENSLMVQQTGVLALSSLTHVLRSLTPNARGIFNLLVDYQLSHKDVATYQGLSFHDLYQKCREAFLVNSELTLRAQLTEFRDHKLIRSKKGLDGVEFLTIAVSVSTLLEFKQQDV